ncbi:TPR-like protein [Teratosphaeria nubilosa]|uniref:TPR-like protein n=1 Tax=Teratosphaeria nubilosa TaxID=161662 RepID=A0A6G1LM13_9PEZI|nr:TPR-like protein [Teratosphaeria nubilosa]
MALSTDDQQRFQAQLKQAVTACNERCLYFAAKWAAELLNSFPADDTTINDDADTDVDDDDQNATPTRPTDHDRREARLEAKEQSRFLMAKSFFDCREFDRCAAVFLPSQIPHSTPQSQASSVLSPSDPQLRKPTVRSADGAVRPPASIAVEKLSQRSLFLALYARYLAGEKRKNEDSETILGPSDGPVTANKEVPGVLTMLEDYFNARGLQEVGNSQGWLEYLYGLVLVRTKSQDLARQWLLRSVSVQPLNWSAWLELASLVDSPETLQKIGQRMQPPHIMSIFWSIHCNIEMYQQTPEVLHQITQLQNMFPTSAWLQQQKALLHYHARDHETALSLFEKLTKQNPHRLEGLEVYSNLLYVLPHRPKLASLASLASTTDRFRPETNCILGNYYSLISEHEKAVLHFRRALTLDRNYQSAWTLMGHEYIELKNTQAAIESYRRAVDADRRDYRAWYGLGQGYEMLECHSYSLFYYRQAAGLCPNDPKMWAAVGLAYAKCDKIANAISAYKRALVVGSQMDAQSSFGSGSDPLANAVGGALDPQILYEIALLYEKESKWEEAAAYMELTLAQEEGAEEGNEGLGVTQLTSRARLWLARWSFQVQDWQRCLELCNELCQDGVEVEDAKGLQRDVRARLHLAEEGEEGERMVEEVE